jgi:hypothetical protein
MSNFCPSFDSESDNEPHGCGSTESGVPGGQHKQLSFKKKA